LFLHYSRSLKSTAIKSADLGRCHDSPDLGLLDDFSQPDFDVYIAAATKAGFATVVGTPDITTIDGRSVGVATARSLLRVEHHIADVVKWPDGLLAFEEVNEVFEYTDVEKFRTQRAGLLAALGLAVVGLRVGKTLEAFRTNIVARCVKAEGDNVLRSHVLLLLALDLSISEADAADLRLEAEQLLKSSDAPPEEIMALLCSHYCMLAERTREPRMLTHARAALRAATDGSNLKAHFGNAISLSPASRSCLRAWSTGKAATVRLRRTYLMR
jgi:hypothetical protein